MALAPLQLPKPKVKLDEFRSMVAQQHQETKRVMDAFSNRAARLGFGSPHLLEGTQYPLTRLTRDYILMVSLYRSNWIVRKIVDAKAEDMTKNWLQLTSQVTPEELDQFNKAIDDTVTQSKICDTLKWARLYGGAGALIVIEGHDDLEKPLELEDVEPGSYKGLLVFDRWSGIYPGPRLVQDINDPVNFGLPEEYMITTDTAQTRSVHHSRVLRFAGRGLPRWEFMAEQYWGISEVEIMYDELKKRDNTSWNIASLMFRANLVGMKQKNLNQLLSGLGSSPQAAAQFWSTFQAISEMMSNQGIVILPEDGGMETHSYSFGGIAEMYQNFMLDICGASEYTMTRLFGRTITGLGQSNEGDEHQYYAQISQMQKQQLDPQLKKLLPIVAMSTWGEVPDDFAWLYKPVRSLTDKDQSELAKTNTDSVIEVVNAGIVGRKTALKELQQQSDTTGMWTNITDEMIEEADDEPMGGMGEMGGAEEPQSATEMLLGPGDDEEEPEPEAEEEESGERETADSVHATDADPDYISTATDDFEESKHTRGGAGTKQGGQFVKKGTHGEAIQQEVKTKMQGKELFKNMSSEKLASLRKRLEAL